MPPNFPQPVPFWWCFRRQARVVGKYWWLCLPLIWDSAWDIKHEIDASRAHVRSIYGQDQK